MDPGSGEEMAGVCIKRVVACRTRLVEASQV